MTSKALIIPAAGSGERMGREIPKPFIELEGRPILAHTISRFLQLEGLHQVIVATSPEYVERAEEILQGVMGNAISWKCVEGGAERQYSIQNALRCVADTQLILVHDAVRPFVKPESIRACCRQAEESGAAVLGVPVKDTIKRVDDEGIVQETPDRSYLWQIQTPQVFETAVLQKAYRLADEEHYFGTDDASLVEWMGQQVRVVRSSGDNIKLTYPQDLEYAKIFLKREGNDE